MDARASTRIARAWAGVAVWLLALACGSEAERPDVPDGPPAAVQPPSPTPHVAASEPLCASLRVGSVPRDASVVLIVSDTMRRDAAGVYGGIARTPRFDRFARDHLLFTRAVSQAPWTKPAIATLFTAQLPMEHGVLDDPHRRDREQRGTTAWNRADILPETFETLAERLRREGLRTAAFVSNPWMEARFGFAQGFHVYDDSFAAFDADGSQVTAAATAWLADVQPHERFFLYVHYIDAHRPYGQLDADEVLAARAAIEADGRPVRAEGEQLASGMKLADGRALDTLGVRTTPTLIELAYRRGVEEFDAAFGALLDAVDRHPLAPSTAILVTSDHGEALYERGYGNHGWTLREEEIAIPLVARLPGVTSDADEIDCLVGLIDLYPTLCDYIDLACAPTRVGRSLLGRGRAGDRERTVVAEAIPGVPGHWAIQNQRYKLHYDPSGRLDSRLVRDSVAGRLRPYSLYDLTADPAQERDLLADAPPPEVKRVAARLSRTLSEVARSETPVRRPREAEISEAMQQRLEALGYLGGDE